MASSKAEMKLVVMQQVDDDTHQRSDVVTTVSKTSRGEVLFMVRSTLWLAIVAAHVP